MRTTRTSTRGTTRMRTDSSSAARRKTRARRVPPRRRSSVPSPSTSGLTCRRRTSTGRKPSRRRSLRNIPIIRPSRPPPPRTDGTRARVSSSTVSIRTRTAAVRFRWRVRASVIYSLLTRRKLRVASSRSASRRVWLSPSTSATSPTTTPSRNWVCTTIRSTRVRRST